MKKSMLNVIILALVLVNLVLTVILTFSLVSTNKKTNSLINKVAQIIDLDVAGVDNSSKSTSVDNGMKVLVNKITNEANKYTYSTISANKSTMETDLLKEFQELFKTETIQSVLINIVVQ